MTNPNGLRKGNLVLVNGVVTEIFSFAEDGNGNYGYNLLQGGMPLFYEYEPISLTPEILGRCGFKKDKRYSGNQSYSNEGIIIEETNGGYELFASEWTIGETFFYLHELQNICRDLFKYELEIKELQNSLCN